ncbi:hypothetical protein FHS14_005726 [Paenibacillus baekrokdamisoli]|nr:hypothetical protein [Paenibacillus baekrokdamisoli]
MMIEVVDVYVNRSQSIDTVHDKTKRKPEIYPSIDRCT